MSIKRYCDRCGAEINPPKSYTTVKMAMTYEDTRYIVYELCVSCAYKLKKFLKAEVTEEWND